jgi:hypothetical protein
VTFARYWKTVLSPEAREQPIVMADERPQVVGEEPMNADVTEAQLTVAALDLGPPIRAQRHAVT